MKKLKMAIASVMCLNLAACGGSDNKNNIQVPELAFVEPAENAVLVEDFPLSLYVTHQSGASDLSGVTSIDVNWPEFDVYQAGIEVGAIDGGSEELFYQRKEASNKLPLNAADIERVEDVYWYVSADNKVTRYNAADDTTDTFELDAGSRFTEVASSEETGSKIWLYDANKHQLIKFDTQNNRSDKYQLSQQLEVQGLALGEGSLLLLSRVGNEQLVAQYQLWTNAIQHQSSWVLEGFEGIDFNDVLLMPDGRMALSSSDPKHNIVLVTDKSEMNGEGPVADSGELELFQQIALAEEIQQPSGLSRTDAGNWLLLTDQAEVFELDSDFALLNRIPLEFDTITCGQGCTEAIVAVGDGFYVMTDAGIVAEFQLQGDGYRLRQEYVIESPASDGKAYEYSGLAYDDSTGNFFVVTNSDDAEEEDLLLQLNGDFTLLSSHTISYPGEAEGSIFQFDAQGVFYEQGSVYVLSEVFTKVLQLNLEGEIGSVYELDNEDVAEPSDIVLHDGLVYITGDHENDEPVPPISVFELDSE